MKINEPEIIYEIAKKLCYFELGANAPSEAVWGLKLIKAKEIWDSVKSRVTPS